MKEILIEQAAKKDYQKLITVWESSVRATHHFLAESDIITYRTLILNEYFDQVQLYCIKQEHEISGFIGINGESIQMLFIHPGAREKDWEKPLSILQKRNMVLMRLM